MIVTSLFAHIVFQLMVKDAGHSHTSHTGTLLAMTGWWKYPCPCGNGGRNECYQRLCRLPPPWPPSPLRPCNALYSFIYPSNQVIYYAPWAFPILLPLLHPQPSSPPYIKNPFIPFPFPLFIFPFILPYFLPSYLHKFYSTLSHQKYIDLD